MAPLPALATEAALPVDPVQTDDEAVIVADGRALIVTELLPVDLQPLLLVTVTDSVTVPEAPAI